MNTGASSPNGSLPREAEEARKQAELERAAKAYNVLPDTPVKPGEIPGLPFKTK